MHELSLFGQFPASRHEQMLQILAGIAAMPPQPYQERCILFKPTRAPVRRAVQVGGSQDIQDASKAARQAQSGAGVGGDLYMAQLVENVTERRWEMRFCDVPEPGKRVNTARMVATTEIVEGDPWAFMAGLGYEYIRQWMVVGHQLIHNNIVLLVSRILHLPQEPSQNSPDINTLPQLDGGYILQASVRVLDHSKPDSMSSATNELARFKEMTKGCLDLRAVDRLALDTRVK